MLRWVGEWIWAYFAYGCGKFLRREKYIPLRAQHDEYTTFVRFSFPVRDSALSKLMHVWGFRLVTNEELEIMLKNIHPSTAPFFLTDTASSHLVGDVLEHNERPNIALVLLLFTALPLLVHVVERIIMWIK